MLDLPALPPCHTFQHPDRLYTADQMHQYARDYAAMLAAAPAASVVDTSTNEAWASRAQEKIAAMDAAASVSERARELLAREYEREGLSGIATCLRKGSAPDGTAMEPIAVRALEQALTQQRGECEAVYQFRDAYGAWRDTTKAHYDIETSLDRRTLYTTPQPGAEALRELVRRILNWQPLTSINKADRLYQILVAAGLPFESVTDELESLLGRGAE